MQELAKRSMEDNRRVHSRALLELEVQLFPGNDGDSDPIKVQLKDLSLLGLAIYKTAECKLKKGDFVRICLSSSTEHAGEINMRRLIHARVAHDGEDCIGLCFESLGVEVLDFMHLLLKNSRLF